MEKLRCPHCGGAAWLETQGIDLILRCLCGLMKYLRQEVEGVTILRTAVASPDVRLPAQGTKIYRCLLAVVGRWPTPIKSAEIARDASLNGKETAALINVLAARRLVERIEERRGLVGGSIWKLTTEAAELFDLLPRR